MRFTVADFRLLMMSFLFFILVGQFVLTGGVIPFFMVLLCGRVYFQTYFGLQSVGWVNLMEVMGLVALGVAIFSVVV